MNESLAMQSVQGLIISIASEFCRQYTQFDRDEIIGESQLYALEAIRNFDPKREVKLATLVYHNIWSRLRGWLKSPTWKSRMAKKNGQEVGCNNVMIPEKFDLESLLSEVSQEAKEAIQIALGQDDPRPGLQNKVRKRLLIDRLKSYGWEIEAIVSVFNEIREAL